MTVGARRRSSALLGRIRARGRSLIGRVAVLGARERGSGRVRASRVVARLAGLLRRVAAVCNRETSFYSPNKNPDGRIEDSLIDATLSYVDKCMQFNVCRCKSSNNSMERTLVRVLRVSRWRSWRCSVRRGTRRIASRGRRSTVSSGRRSLSLRRRGVGSSGRSCRDGHRRGGARGGCDVGGVLRLVSLSGEGDLEEREIG